MKYRTSDKKHIVFMMSFPALLICRPLAYMLMQMKPADREIIQGVTVQKDKSLPRLNGILCRCPSVTTNRLKISSQKKCHTDRYDIFVFLS